MPSIIPIDVFMKEATQSGIARVPGTAVFLTRTLKDAPPVMVWHVKHNRALHEKLFILTVTTEFVPWIRNQQRMTVQEIASNVWRSVARYGFMERPDIPALLKQAHEHKCTIGLADVTYYVGHETILPDNSKKSLPHWVKAIFSFMQRNSLHVSDYFRLPSDALVEIGRQIAI